MIIGVPKETFPGEQRVAVVPALLPMLQKKNYEILIESGAGMAAGYTDQEYLDKGAKLGVDRAQVFKEAQVILQVRGFGANPEAGAADLPHLNAEKTLIAFLDPLGSAQHAQTLAKTGVRALSMELMPRITRAQSMDALSSMATLAGYKAVLIGASELMKMFPMLMTAAGSIKPARVFILGVGVAGLQAIATAKRLGALVDAYDIRPEVKDQVISVGGKFVELDIEEEDSSDSGGYAKAKSDDFYKKQQELLQQHISGMDIVITTAAVPGRKAPILVPESMVHAMAPGSVIVDLAAENGGNCALTKAGETHEVNGVKIVGPLNVPSSLAYNASAMYGKNITTFLNHLSDAEKGLHFDLEDEIVSGTLVCQDGNVVHPRVKDILEPQQKASA
jgi:NAD(P) transhydrogenase subunit alpha